MRRACKIALYVVVILLPGIFSQQKIKAEEINERYYSRTYSILSANVGNSKPRSLPIDPIEVKLQPGPDEERVKAEIQRLVPAPDVLILIEAYDRDQVLRICNSTGESYFVPDGLYDFVCVKNDIIAEKDNGEQDIEHVQMPGGNGSNVGYIDVGLKDENGRKVRLFYAHFPSPRGIWTLEKHKTHRDAFDWICQNLKPNIPCLIGGDLNNDFTRGKSQIDIEAALITNPLLQEKYREEQAKVHSSLYIEERVRNLNLWIFNPPAQPLQLQLLDGSTEHNYETTYRLPGEAWKMTIDWVMGKFCLPPFLAPGGPETDLVTGTTGTIRTNFVTSPPNWWKDTGLEISRLRFDHKPLYGNVVFFWEDRAQPAIKDWKEYNLGAVSFSVPSDWHISSGSTERTMIFLNEKIHFTASAVELPADEAHRDAESGKWSIVYQDSYGGIIKEEGLTEKTLFVGSPTGARLVDSFKKEIAGYSVIVCITKEQNKKEWVSWKFVLIKNGKVYVFDLSTYASTFPKQIFEQLVARMCFLPKKD